MSHHTNVLQHIFSSLDVKNLKLACDWMKENFPTFIKLSSHYISPSFLTSISTDVENQLQKEHLVDFYSILPTDFTSSDLESVLRHITNM